MITCTGIQFLYYSIFRKTTAPHIQKY